MKLGAKSEEAFTLWIGTDTWHTGHWCDEGRFFDFVDAYSREHGYTLDEAALREMAVRHARISENKRLVEELNSYIRLMVRILLFLEHVNR